MKKTFLTLLLAVMFILPLNARTFVLVTGVSNYGDEVNNLSQTTKDAKRFREVMLQQTKDVSILTSSNVTRANVLEKLRAICNRAQEGDKVIFFYSGHGMPGAICGYDAPISYDDLTGVLATSKASQKICFIDACHAGTMANAASKAGNKDWAKAVAQQKGQAFFVSSRAEEVSRENPILGAGFFTAALLKGIRGKSDTNADRKVTVLELFKYIHADVVKRSKKTQHPQLIAPKEMHNAIVAEW